MNKEILDSCVNSRKNALLQTCNNDEMLTEINEYFERVEEFAKNCSDVADFESKFAISELSKEYTDLFTKVMTNPDDANKEKESLAKEVGNEIADDVYHGVRRKAYQETYDKARDIPVVGEALNIKQHFDLFSRFKRKKDK